MWSKFKKNQAIEFAFPMVDKTNPENFKSGESVSFTAYRYNSGWEVHTIAGAVSELGSTGMYKLSLTAGETNYDYYVIKFTAANSQASMIAVKTTTRDIEDVAYPTTSGRSIDVTAGGCVGIDWGNIETPGATVDLSDTTIKLCDTVTANSDMRGTDSALLASAAPANFADLTITATTGRVTVGTNTDKAGYSIAGSKTTLDALQDISAAAVNAEVDNALNTAIPGSPTADSLNERIKAIDDKLPAGTISDFDESSNNVTVGTNTDKSGYSISGSKQTLDALQDISAATVNAEVDNALNTAIPGSPTANSINERIAAIDNKLPTGSLSDFDEASDQVIVSTNNDKADYALSAAALAAVNAQIDDVLRVDTQTELSSMPSASAPTLVQAILLVYQALRNKRTATSSLATIHKADGTQIGQAVLSDVSGTTTKNAYT